jgi:Mrp family chromosome partitioning ATPase
MTRVLEALKVLEARRQGTTTAGPREAPLAPLAASTPRSPMSLRSTPPAEAPGRAAAAHRVSNMCLLPTVPIVADHYHELAERISAQLATNYCNVILFVTADDAAEPCFSLTHLAQAFSLQSAGDVLLVDGDLQRGRLTKSVCPDGPGMIEAVSGTAPWPEVIHPTTTPRIDFVSRGQRQSPASEPPEFGWGALRPKYRAVLIGLADTRQPETAWLAAHCDAVYFVISRPHTKRQAATAAVEALRASGANLLGCVVVND